MPGDNYGPAHRRSSSTPDLDSVTKAAAWVWYLHGKCDVREGQYIFHTKSLEKKVSRFKMEAMQKEKPGIQAAPMLPHGVWDCESKLYDSFELLCFTDRLDRSLAAIPLAAAPNSHHLQSPLHQSAGFRTMSMPHNLSTGKGSDSVCGPACPPPGNGNVKKKPRSRWSVQRLVQAIKKVATMKFRKRSGAKKNHGVHDHEQFHHHRHLHHHHHHHHHHHLHSLAEAGEDLPHSTQTIQAMSTISHRCSSGRSDSARLSTDTMVKLCADVNWV